MIAWEETTAAEGNVPAFVTRIRLRAHRRALWLRRLWSQGAGLSEQGMAIGHSEVDRILAGSEVLARAECAFYATDAAARQWDAPIREWDARVCGDPLLNCLQQAFDLSDAERDLLTLAAAAEIDPLLLRVYGYLHDDVAGCYPTPWLAAGLFPEAFPAAFGAECGLVRWQLALPQQGTASLWSPMTPWVADPQIVALLTGQADAVRMAGTEACAVLTDAARDLCLYEATLTGMEDFVRALETDNFRQGSQGKMSAPIELQVIGDAGAGKRTLAAQLCARLGGELLTADAAVILSAEGGQPVAVERGMRVLRAARLQGAALYWHNADEALPQIWNALPVHDGLTILGATSPVSLPKRPDIARKTFRLPPLLRAARTAFWQALTDAPTPLPIEEWMLNPAEIVNAALVAPAGIEAITEACRKPLAQEAGNLFTPLPCPYTWDDLILPPIVRRHIMELEAQARLRWSVYEDWGFERLCPLGRGITALFSGPSGTGKTMAAQVMARSLDMELYRVDLASVMSKYIGETEKNLKRIFDACQRANVLLFFDEADALFGQRTQVKDAHDRFANIEIDYLLQRMEQFDGIAVLASNRKGDMDTAFLRRLRFVVDFVPPGVEERKVLWQRVLPAAAPDGETIREDIDWQKLAEALSMTGADIKGAALGAAFLARAEGVRIGLRHVLHAARREMTKHGITLRTEGLEK